MTARTPLHRALAGLALAAAAAAPAAAQALDPATWAWPASASDAKLRRSIVEGGYTQQELRNIYAQLMALSPTPGGGAIAAGAGASANARGGPGAAGGAARPPDGAASQNAGWSQVAAAGIRPGRGFRGLDALFNGPGFMGGPQGSMADRRNIVDTIVAKGDRVIVLYRIEGHHTGSFYGFAGTGKPLQVRQFAVARHDEQGRIVEAEFYGDDFALFTQLGGRIEFPKESK